jgi:hypothetical protein
MQRRAATTLLLAAPAVLRARDAPLRLRYPQPMRRDIPVRSLPLELLRRAVERAGRVVELEPSQHVMVQARSARELAADSGLIDLLWTVTSREREQALRPVRIPIFRGLYGWRLLLVRRGDSARFAALRSLADLQPLRLLQGADWPDTRVLRDNGLRVETAQSFESLFKMLQAARGDAFPRGVTEIGWEQSQRSDRFEVEPAWPCITRRPSTTSCRSATWRWPNCSSRGWSACRPAASTRSCCWTFTARRCVRRACTSAAR